ncbi:MAG: glycerophosphodiester phosphodiesterase [Gammaproteobacteria bacterium]|nr:glycerophosphodiester phosphodiesterase [Gammaproteobacteria bacterium]
MQPSSFDFPPLIGHRGLAALAPENTLAGLRTAKAHGLDMVEFDVRLSEDKIPMLFHDDELDRTSFGKGRFRDYSAQWLGQLDVGLWFSARFAGETVPTLWEALRLCRELGLRANIEIKANPGEDEATVAATTMVLHGLNIPANQVLLSSFSTTALAAALHRCPEYPRGLLCENWPEAPLEVLRRLACTSLHCDADHIDYAETRTLRDHGHPVLAYTVNEQEFAEFLWQQGVTSLFCDEALKPPS